MSNMSEIAEDRACNVARYIIEHRCTVRQAAREFHVSKSTIFKDVTERVLTIDPQLHADVLKVLKYNKSQRHIRGGESTKKNYDKC